MTRTDTTMYLPDGQPVFQPVQPRTWVDAAATVPGDPVKAWYLMHDVAGAVAWQRKPAMFQGVTSVAQGINSSTWSPIGGYDELVDTHGGHNDGTNTSRYYAPQSSAVSAGSGGDWYLASGYIPFDSSSATNVFIAGLRVNGGTVFEGQKQPSAAGHAVDCMVMDLVQLNGRNDNYVELCAWQNTGVLVNTLVSGKSPSFTVRWVGADPAWAGIATPALPALPHTWTDTDIVTGSATGAGKVPLNTEIRDLVNFLHNPPLARLTSQGTTQTIPPGASTWTSINFTAAGETLDNYGGWAAATPSRYVCKRAGLYLLYGLAAVAEPASPAGYRAARLLINGTTAYAGGSCFPATGTTAGTALPAVAQVRLAVNDYVEVQMLQTQGAALSVKDGVGDASRLVAVWKSR
ncbi:hypothetical protein [Actinomadura montaniterrae]|uniref:Uncharacterized protein n=1 Tax=Actinomadura montaniterrae TaxID=1803903 RepID=A0A6L3VZ97_9ACTN|nr:hypothetical protein [Actinomadura montaniterrae]KAB2384762.1 hypothetical protein F9B16_09955 [Actinomadura montaniterrae]